MGSEHLCIQASALHKKVTSVHVVECDLAGVV